MMRISPITILALGACLSSAPAHAQDATGWSLASPRGAVEIDVRQVRGEGVEYAVRYKGRRIVEWSKLGLALSWVDPTGNGGRTVADFGSTITVSATAPHPVSQDYLMVTGKQRQNHYAANEIVLSLTDAETARTIDIAFQAADDGVAFRYVLTGKSTLFTRIDSESTAFAFGPGGDHWGQVYDKADVWQPAYEAPWGGSVPVGTGVPASKGAGWSVPALFRDEGGAWILLHESGLSADFHASHLAPDADDGIYRIAGPLPSDGLGSGSTQPVTMLPAALPWRFLVIGDSPSAVAQSNRVFDLAENARIADTAWVRPGVANWSWPTDHDSSQDLGKLVRFIRAAGALGLDYSLVDANWNRIGNDVVEQLVAEADKAGVGLMFWYNSGGAHNAVTEEPRNLMDERMRRRTEFARLSRLGVKGVKIDFFQSDKQERIRQYLEILEDAAEFHLMVNFHGCTVPRGWQRTWPNLMTMEAVRGGEHYSFESEPDFAHLAPLQNTTLPFTRNVIGSMDFTPIGFSSLRRPHITTNAHEAALGVVFESGLQHLMDSVEGYDAASADYRAYLSDLPGAWDETRFLSGFPGRDVVVARRAGRRWYVAGLNGLDTARTLNVDLGFLAQPSAHALILEDGKAPRGFASRRASVKKGAMQVRTAPFGGFVMVIDPR